MAGPFSQTIPQIWRRLSTWGDGPLIIDPTWGGHPGLVVGVFDCGPTGRQFESASCRST